MPAAAGIAPDQKGTKLPAYIVLTPKIQHAWSSFTATSKGWRRSQSMGTTSTTRSSPNQEGLMLVLQRVPEAKLGKNRAHFDIVVEDLDASTTRVGQLGGRWIEPGKTHELEGFRWRCMADPEGNEFCFVLGSSRPNRRGVATGSRCMTRRRNCVASFLIPSPSHAANREVAPVCRG